MLDNGTSCNLLEPVALLEGVTKMSAAAAGFTHQAAVERRLRHLGKPITRHPASSQARAAAEVMDAIDTALEQELASHVDIDASVSLTGKVAEASIQHIGTRQRGLRGRLQNAPRGVNQTKRPVWEAKVEEGSLEEFQSITFEHADYTDSLLCFVRSQVMLARALDTHA